MKYPARWIMRTSNIVAMMNGLGSIDFPPRFEVGESPIIPAEDIGMEILDLLRDMENYL